MVPMTKEQKQQMEELEFMMARAHWQAGLPVEYSDSECSCGCHGDYTEHSMRAGESGRSASIIIR